MMRKIICVLILMVITASVPTDVFCLTNTGTATGAFLKMGPGARPSGMGGAFAGISDDVNAIYWNPAGAVRAASMEVTASYIQWFEDINNTYVGLVYPLGKKNAFGFGFNYLTLGSIEVRDATGVIDTSADSSVSEQSISLVYSRLLTKSLSLGLTAKQLTQKLAVYNGAATVIDAGIMYVLNNKLSLGLSALNVGSGVVIDNVTNDLPMIIKLGCGYKPMDNLIVGFDVDQPSDSDMVMHIGAEFLFNNVLALRAGFSNGIALGFGIVSPIKSESEWGEEKELYIFEIDYAAVTIGETGEYGHRVSMNLKF